MVSPQAFERDPLRTLRLARLASELEFGADPDTVATASASAPGLRLIAGERVFAELKRIMISDRPLEGLDLMDRLGATDAVLPELSELRGIEQSGYHHLDVYAHTRAVLAETIELEREPDRWLEEAVPVLEEYAKGSPQPVMQAIEEARSRKVADDLDAFLAGRFGKRMVEPIKAIHLTEEDRPIETMWDVTVAATAHARSIPNTDKRLEIERAAGDLLKLVA